MKKVLEKIEDSLTELASIHVPEGSDTRAVVHQWAHAVAFDKDIFLPAEAGNGAQQRCKFKDQIIDKLKHDALYTSRDKFRSLLLSELAIQPVEKPTFTFIDLFAGIGGMRLGFQNNGGACVFSSEFEKNAQATYLNNHGEMPFGDITKIEASSIPDHDILLAGFPCQPFSHAGLKLGIEDTRGTLFHDIARIIDVKRPRFALLENVKGLISHDKGYTLQVVLKTLTSIGYSCNISKDLIRNGSAKDIQTEAKKMVLKSTDFGVPQNRQRIYIVLWQDGLIDKFDYPQPSGEPTRVGDILETSPSPSLTISDRLWSGHLRRKEDNKNNGKGFGFGLVTADSAYTNTISARYYKDGSEILIAQDGKNPRKLSLREAARLQGFPDTFQPSASSVQAYKQFGNSVSVPTIEAIAAQIISNL